MMLTEQITVPDAAIPVAEFKDHLRLGTGFADDGDQDALLKALLRASMAAIEARTGKAVLTRVFSWTVTAWREAGGQALPVAPVSVIQSVVIVDRDGEEKAADPGVYRLVPDTHRPRLEANGAQLPGIPVGGSARVVFEAGFGPDWADVPSDLAQAVFLLAAHYYEHRQEAQLGDRGMPFGVSSLIERWRTVRILGGQA